MLFFVVPAFAACQRSDVTRERCEQLIAEGRDPALVQSLSAAEAAERADYLRRCQDELVGR